MAPVGLGIALAVVLFGSAALRALSLALSVVLQSGDVGGAFAYLWWQSFGVVVAAAVGFGVGWSGAALYNAAARRWGGLALEFDEG